MRPRGWLGLVLPDPLLARTNAAKERAHLLKDFTIHHLWHLADVFAAHVGAIVIIAQKCPPQNTHQISWAREKWRSNVGTAYGAQFIAPNGHELNEKGEEAQEEHATRRGRGRVGLGGDPCGRPLFPFGQTSPIPMGDHKDPHSALPLPRPYAPAPSFFHLGDEINYLPTVPQSLFLNQPGAEFRYLLSTEPGPAIERLRSYFDQTPASHRQLAPLSEFLSIRRGEELGMGSSLLIHEDMIPPSLQYTEQRGSEYRRGKRGEDVEGGPLWSPVRVHHISSFYLNGIAPCGCPVDGCPASGNMDDHGRPLHSYHSRGTPCGCPVDGCPGGGEQVSYPVLRGGRDVRPYGTSFSGWWIAREAITKPIERYLSPKLLVVKSTDRLQAALDTRGHVALQTLYLLHPHTRETSQDDLYFFLSLLNSRLLRQYVYVLHTAYKWVQPQIEQHVLARLPIPIVTSNEKQQIIERAKLLARACSEIGPVVEWDEPVQNLYEEQERAICALYASALC